MTNVDECKENSKGEVETEETDNLLELKQKEDVFTISFSGENESNKMSRKVDFYPCSFNQNSQWHNSHPSAVKIKNIITFPIPAREAL